MLGRCVLAVGLVLALSGAGAGDPARKYDFEIPALRADAALKAFARQAEVPLLFPYDRVKTLQAHAVSGRYTLNDALGMLLQDTGLSSSLTKGGVITISAPPSTAEQNGGRDVNGKSKLSLLGSIAAIFGIGAGPHLVWADESKTAMDRPDLRLEEVIVTARRREENVQKVPETDQVISQQALTEQNVSTLRDLQYLVPGLSGSTNTPNAIGLTLRGQGTNGNRSWPAVIILYNEVPLSNFNAGSSQSAPGMFFDLENVQVLKGPQGTLFGKGSAGGDVLLTSARPTNQSGGYFDIGLGNYNNRETDGVFNLPIIDNKVLTRVAFSSQTRDGYTNILGTPSHPNGIDGDNRDSRSLRISVTIKPTDWFRNDTILTDVSSSTRGTYGVIAEVIPGGAIPASVLDPLFAQQQALGIRTVLPISVDPVANISMKSLTNITSIGLGRNVTLKNIFGYDDESNAFAGDQDNTVLQSLDIYSYPYTQSIVQYTDELQLAGRSFGERLDWVVGGFYLDQPMPSSYRLANFAVLGSPLHALDKQSQESRAMYAHAIYDLSKVIHGLSFNAGVRSTNDDYVFIAGTAPPGFCTGSISSCSTGTITTAVGSSHAVTWTAGVSEQLSSKTMVYLTASKGYRPGGQNQFDTLLNGFPPPFDPEYVLEDELGVKADWRIGGIPVHTNIAFWYQDYTGIQKQVVHPDAQGGAWTQNGGTAHLWGTEIEAHAYLTPDLEVGVNYGSGEIKYVSFLPGVDAGTITYLNNTKTLNFPKSKYDLFTRYHLPVAADVGDVALQANWNWQAASGDYSETNGMGVTKSFGLLNLSANWTKVYGKPFDLQFYASNVTNKEYLTQASPSWMPGLGYTTQVFGEPRMYGVRLKYHFGGE